MRHKEHSNSAQHSKIAEPIRLVGYWVNELDALPTDIQQRYSEMKYGAVAAGDWWVDLLANMILQDAKMAELHSKFGQLYVASSAYGAIPTAATNLTTALAEVLQTAGWKVKMFKIDRLGGFERTNYGSLGASARKRAMRSRKLTLNPELLTELKGQAVLVVDDIRCTGMHEREVITLFANQADLSALSFAYCIGFQGDLLASGEEELNHAKVVQPNDLLPFFEISEQGPRLNARLLKFILLQTPKQLQDFLPRIGTVHALRFYEAALSEDGYFDKTRFKPGFAALEAWLMKEGALTYRGSFEVRNAAEGKLVVWNVVDSAEPGFDCAETGVDLSQEVSLYSRFKFGDVNAIQSFAKRLSDKVIGSLEAGGSLSMTFERAKQRGEFINLTAPGIRNVVSASNALMREAGMRINVWLTAQGLPTMILRTLGRLSSGRANYAELTARQRQAREKTTQTIIPQNEYASFPSHVIFLDDIEVTGQTANRARESSLAAGALSFHSFFLFRVDPEFAKQDAGIEHRMNHFAVNRTLDSTIGDILRHPDYQPVQRMLRLLLHAENRNVLPAFLDEYASDAVLLRLYFAAMGNDYLWIHANAEGDLGEYGPSLELIRQSLITRGLLDDRGLPI
jgi:predicted amidophosphoribosyltransferase